jgi:Glycosyl hydrolase catalytic core/Secretion system C-terminal sorting domain
MKKNLCLLWVLWAFNTANAQLTIYSDFNQQGTSGTCEQRTIYTGVNVPNGLNDGIKSIALKQGYMATLAANADGTGEGFCYIAAVSDLNVNLAFVLQKKVSFIRVLRLPTTPVLKKGAGATNNDEVAALNVSWFYDWGLNDESTPTREFTPMAWGAGGASDASVNGIIAKNSLTHLLAFNEPDNKGQSNIATNAAVPLYKNLLRSGYRTGSPGCTESQYRVWLSEFTNLANLDKLRIDFVAVHWYDWGTWLTGLNRNPNPVDVFNRFKAYINNVYALYQKPIWITEFNANVNRPPAVHEAFMKLALPYLDSDPRVERYAYFFGNDVPARSGNALTTAGQIYNSHVSTPAFSGNIYDKRPVFPDIVAWDTSNQTNGGESNSNFSPTFLDASLTAPTGLTRGAGVSTSGLVANGYWGASDWATTAEAGIANKKFLTFSVKTTNEKIVSFSSINKFKIRIAATGPTKYKIDYQVDGGEFKTATTITGAEAITGDYSLGPIDLSNIAALQNVPPAKTITFRMTPFAASGTGVFYFGAGAADSEADFSITGNVSDLVLGVNEPSNSSLVVYPSVATGNYIHVTFGKISADAQIKICNLNGQLISTHNVPTGVSSQTIDITNFTEGGYILTLQDKENIQSRKFIKQ